MPDFDRLNQIGDSEDETDLSQTLNKVIAALVRKRWLMIGTACSIILGTIAVLLYLPDQYTSEATLFAVQSRVPERYVVPTTTSDVSQALEAMVQEVLSRPRLLQVINELGLYPKQRQTLDSEQLIQLMRHDVLIEPVVGKLGNGDVNAFKISFIADNPQKAQAVTQELTTLFIEQNLKARADQAATTTGFLHEQLENAKQTLTEHEQRLRDFKMQYLGELPEQQQGNLGILTGLETQLDNVMSNRNHAQQQRLYLESLLSQQARQRRRAGTAGISSTGQSITPLEAAHRDLARLQSERRSLLTMYTAQHPDVHKKEQEIRTQESFIQGMMSAETTAPSNQERPAENAPDAEDDIGILQLKNQLQANSFDIEALTKKELKLRVDIDQYRSRLNLSPVREQQLTSLQRDYDLLKQHYGDLLKKEQESQLATNLEKRQEGQQFRLADPPNLPIRPSSPKRVQISLIAIAVGLIAGSAIAILADLKRNAMHTEGDVSTLALPLVVGVPLFITPVEVRNRSIKRAVECFAGSLLVFIVAVAEMYILQRG